MFATVGTLFLVPVIYSLLKTHPPIDYTKEIEHEYHEGDQPGTSTGHSGAARVMANDPNEKKLPWPEESDPAKLGDEFADTTSVDRHAIAESFADPNSLDDARIGKNFVETNSSAKKKHKPLKEVIHKPTSKKPIWIVAGIVLVLFVLVLLIGGLPKLFTKREIDKDAKNEKDAKPMVTAAKVKSAGGQAGLALPGTTIPLNEAFVYARASGYLQSLKVDIGDHVRKGQLLATIDAPDLDAQVDQARQQLKQAEQQLEQQKSQLALATVTVQRYRVLVTKGVFSRQQGDQQEATYASELANVAAAQTKCGSVQGEPRPRESAAEL